MSDRESTAASEGASGWVLAIEASNPSAGYVGVAGAIEVGGGCLSDPVEVEYEAGARRADGLLPAIERVRRQLGVTPDDLRCVCVSNGPGGYTGLRVSVTVAKAIASATGAELVAVPSAMVALGGRDLGSGCIVCLASKGELTHATVFDPASERAPVGAPVGMPVGMISANELPGLIGSTVIADGYLPASIRDACAASDKQVEPPRFSATQCLALGYEFERADPAALAPVYAREPEAVRLWRERHGGIG